MKIPDILIYDTETSPNLGWFWRTGKQVVGANQILRCGKIICVSYRFLHWPEGKVKSIRWSKTQDDKQLVKRFSKIANKADVILGHNGDSFDKRWFNTRLAFHEMPTLQHLSTEDTLKQCRKHFYLPSYKLDYICKYFGIEGKISTTFGLWERVTFDNDKEALTEMSKYCDNDVLILDKLYKRIRPYITPKLNMSTFLKSKACVNCGSTDIRKNGKRIAGKTIYQQWFCKGHGGYAGKSLIPKKKSKLPLKLGV